MSPLRSLIIDSLNNKKESLKERIEILAIKYFIILQNDEIDNSDDDSILDRLDIKYSFTFIKVRYSPQFYFYVSWLPPLIVTNDLKVSNGMIEFNNWFCYFNGQSLNTQPTSLNYRIVDRYEKYLTSDRFTMEL
ncbi:MAG TPA: hypothetical protein VGK10_12610, partial [Prolixibacteraceae bacterium]